MDEVFDRPKVPPFRFPALSAFQLVNILEVNDDWINFITRHETIKDLTIFTMCDGNDVTIDDDVINNLAENSNFHNELTIKIYGNKLSVESVGNFLKKCKGLMKLHLVFDYSYADRFDDFRTPQWNIKSCSSDVIFEKILN